MRFFLYSKPKKTVLNFGLYAGGQCPHWSKHLILRTKINVDNSARFCYRIADWFCLVHLQRFGKLFGRDIELSS
jgi:hypothetical protein